VIVCGVVVEVKCEEVGEEVRGERGAFAFG
jgi:hypothetical protein